MYSATATAPVNIATLKYWGKRDVKLNLPTNSSLSVTLSQADMCATTTSTCSDEFDRDELILNDQPEEIGGRTAQVLAGLRAERARLEASNASLPKISDLKLHISSFNNFPTAAGLASSAAGFAALVKSVSLLYELPLDASDLSVYARQGSGSACRSLFGGYVAWEMGEKEDGSDSRAIQIADENHWHMKAAILVVCADKKDVPSTQGMQRTVKTSALFKERVESVVPARYKEFVNAIKSKDFPSFARLTMQDSNQFHAVCLDSYPPIFYLNDVSKAAIKAVEAINEKAGKEIAAYTFDAGPNCVVYYQPESEKSVLEGFSCLAGIEGFPIENGEAVENYEVSLRKGVSKVILTQIGEGAKKK